MIGAAIRCGIISDVVQCYLIPLTGESQVAQTLWVATIANLMQLNQCNRSLEMLIAKLVVDRASDTRRGDVMDDKKNAQPADHQEGAHHQNDDLRRPSATPSRLRRKR